jgi:two-component system, NarL family, sensor histidine kinase DesK
MVLALAPPPTRNLGPAPVGWGVVVGVEERERTDRGARWLRLAGAGALVYSSVFSLVQLGLVLEYPGGSATEARWALAATACYLPLHLHHVRWAVRGARPPAGGVTLAAMVAVVTAAVPLAGAYWLPVFAVVAVSAVLVLPWPWSLAAATAVVLAQWPLATAVDGGLPAAQAYYVFIVWWRASALFVPIWLLGAIRQLESARRALAAEAVVHERLQIDDELRRTVGPQLDAIAARGERAVALAAAPASPVGPDDAGAAAAAELRALVDGSRRALAEARQLVSGYQHGSLTAELERAATLLTAAGIATRVELPDRPLPPTADESVRDALRAATTRVLQDDAARVCTIRVVEDRGDGTGPGRVRVELRPEHQAAGW